MSKDPAFLFYSSDFLTGTIFMTNEQVGIYIRLLCAQHQHGGIIRKDDFEQMANGHNVIRCKFVETEDGFYNERLKEVIEKRSGWRESRIKNLSKRHMDSHMDVHMDTHMENENINTSVLFNLKDKKREKPEKQKFLDDVFLTAEEHAKLVERLGADRTQRAIEILDNYLGQNEKNRKRYTSHYKAILSWVIKRLEEDERKSNGNTQQPVAGSYASRLAYRHGPEQERNIRNLQATLEQRERERAERSGSDPK